ncbi:uncharacterized protein LOC144130278 isoform X2 [Amblyomma americanum]
MPLLTEGAYPRNVVAKQKEILARRGYHVIFDAPCKITDGFEKKTPCEVKDKLSVHLFLLQKPLTYGRRFRFNINLYERPHYVEIGDFGESIALRVNHLSYGIGMIPTSQNPKNGDYFWIEFRFTGRNMCEGYYKDKFIAKRETVFSVLQYFYMHGKYYNSAELLSLHFTRTDGRSPILGNIRDTDLGFTLPTSMIYMQGTYTGEKDDPKIKISTYEHGNKNSTKKTFDLDPGKTRPQMITFEVMAFLISASAGDGHVLAETKVSGGEVNKACIVSIERNFTVDSVTIVSTFTSLPCTGVLEVIPL